ncbi:hypothetical protein BC827DRAFT_1229584 [Russula dissimulans]|nr:hypothetical protein BC827DRAFT_1229584 [Russula dissimulans]
MLMQAAETSESPPAIISVNGIELVVCYYFWRFVGGVICVLFALGGTLTITSLSSIPIFIIAHFVPRFHLNIWLLVYVCFMCFVHIVRMLVNAITLRVRRRKPARQYAVGLRAAIWEQYGELTFAFHLCPHRIYEFCNCRVVRCGSHDLGVLMWDGPRLVAAWRRLSPLI